MADGFLVVGLAEGRLAAIDGLLGDGQSREEWVAELVGLALVAAEAFDSAGRGGLGERLVADPSRVSCTLGRALRR